MQRGTSSAAWKGCSVLITAGPTREYLDPVRFLTNASSGMMGFALAKAARDLGAKVTVVRGPTRIAMPWGVRVVPVTSAEEMFQEVLARYRRSHVFIGAAAVSDWRFVRQAAEKIKKTGKPLKLTLLPNPDIIAELARRRLRPLLIGFALETRNWLSHARKKLHAKGLDLIVANRATSLGMHKAKIAFIRPHAPVQVLASLSKARAAREILRYIEKHLIHGR